MNGLDLMLGAFGVFSLACFGLGCSGPPGAGLLRGEDIGTFEIDATELENSCGAGALGASANWSFSVELSAGEGELYWDGRASSPVADSSFKLVLTVPVPVARASVDQELSCTVVRTDTISGQLQEQADQYVSLTGQMLYEFAPQAVERCGPEVATQSGLERLPCQMLYDLSGERVRAPVP